MQSLLTNPQYPSEHLLNLCKGDRRGRKSTVCFLIEACCCAWDARLQPQPLSLHQAPKSTCPRARMGLLTP